MNEHVPPPPSGDIRPPIFVQPPPPTLQPLALRPRLSQAAPPLRCTPRPSRLRPQTLPRPAKAPPPRVSLKTLRPCQLAQSRSFRVPFRTPDSLRPLLLRPSGPAPPRSAAPPLPQAPPPTLTDRVPPSPPPGRGSGGCASCAVCSASPRAAAPRRVVRSSR